MASRRSSAYAEPMSCAPSGKPSRDMPIGNATAGTAASLTGTVETRRAAPVNIDDPVGDNDLFLIGTRRWIRGRGRKQEVDVTQRGIELPADATGVHAGLCVLEPGHTPAHVDERCDFRADAGVVPQVAVVMGHVGPHVHEAFEVGIELRPPDAASRTPSLHALPEQRREFHRHDHLGGLIHEYSLAA